MEPSEMTPPKPTVGDYGHTIVKAGLSAIPFVGGPAAELFSAFIVPPLTKRRDKWVESIAEGVKQLEDKLEGFTIESLQTNETFTTAVMHATQVALRNHQQEKLDALRNVVLNAAARNAPDDDILLMCLNFVDTLTPWHLRILHFFADPLAYVSKSAMSIAQALEEAFPELRGRREFYDQVARDLYTRGLIGIESLHTTMTPAGVLTKRTTAMGDRFITLVSLPL